MLATIGTMTYIAANCNEIPTIEQWTQWMNDAPADQAVGLLRHAHSCLSQNVQNQQWGVLIGIAEQILKEWSIQY